MYVKIKNIATAKFGPYEQGTSTGELKYLLTRHFDQFNELTDFSASYIPYNEKNSHFVLEPNDVILAGKGVRLFAWAYDQSLGQVVPSSLFYIIRVKSKNLRSKYLAIWLNSPKVQQQLTLRASGPVTPALPKGELMNLDIYLPSLKKQDQIIHLNTAFNQEITLTEQLAQKKRDLKRGILSELLTEPKDLSL